MTHPQGSGPRRGVLIGRSAAAGTAALLLVGCSGTSDEPAPSFSPEQSSLIPGAYANPLDPVIYPDEVQQRALTAAGEAVVAQCMAERGFDYASHQVFGQNEQARDAQYVYGVTDPESAAVNGMNSALWMEAVTSDRSSRVEPPAGYFAALFGDPGAVEVPDGAGLVIASYDPDSCAGIAKDRVTPDWPAQEYLRDVGYQILLDAFFALEQDPRVVDAERAWSACMAERGYDYDGVWDANDAEEFSGDLPTAYEIEVAVASAQCQHDSGRLRTVSLVRAELTQEQLAEHPGLVTEWLAAQQHAADALSSQ